MTKMETLHSKQQNVLRRKMEEATALNKRLKDIMEKQKANSKFGKGAAGASNAGEIEEFKDFPDSIKNKREMHYIDLYTLIPLVEHNI